MGGEERRTNNATSFFTGQRGAVDLRPPPYPLFFNGPERGADDLKPIPLPPLDFVSRRIGLYSVGSFYKLNKKTPSELGIEDILRVVLNNFKKKN